MCDWSVRTVWPALPPEYRAGSRGGRASAGKVAAALVEHRHRHRSIKRLPHSSPSHLVAEFFLAEPGFVKVDRPEGGDPMYAWGGTLTNPGGAYNLAQRWEGDTPNRRRSRHYLSGCDTPRLTFPPTRARYSGRKGGPDHSHRRITHAMKIAKCKLQNAN
jgi:hypothetical protein